VPGLILQIRHTRSQAANFRKRVVTGQQGDSEEKQVFDQPAISPAESIDNHEADLRLEAYADVFRVFVRTEDVTGE
jgi:hypothetical protein